MLQIKSIVLRVIVMTAIYFGLTFWGGDVGGLIFYPIRMLVTFLHEFGHAIGALLTGGSVLDVQINQDGSGFTRSMGGRPSIILMGGYIGSALFGNLLFLIGARARQWVNPILVILAASMFCTAIFWFNSIFTTILLILFGLGLIVIGRKTNFGPDILMFLGLASILYIIQDFRVGPSSDLQKYSEIMYVLPQQAWMYIWLGIVLILTFFNLRLIFRQSRVKKSKSI